MLLPENVLSWCFKVNSLILGKHFPFFYSHIFIIAHFHIKLNVLFHHQGNKKVNLKQDQEKKKSAIYRSQSLIPLKCFIRLIVFILNYSKHPKI